MVVFLLLGTPSHVVNKIGKAISDIHHEKWVVETTESNISLKEPTEQSLIQDEEKEVCNKELKIFVKVGERFFKLFGLRSKKASLQTGH